MAHTKAGGSTHLGRDSASKRLGVKLFDGQVAKAGNILIRQRGSKFLAGTNVRKGADDTLYSVMDGIVKFSSKINKTFTDDHEMVFRRGEFASSRTLGVRTDKAAMDIPRSMMVKMKDPKQKMTVEIIGRKK